MNPVVAAILRHPALYNGPRMVKPPAVYVAGLLRALKRGIDTEAWTWLMQLAGQSLFFPPNVAGWDDSRWLDTSTFRGRWYTANYALQPYAATDKQHVPDDAHAIVDGALKLLGRPTIRPETRALLMGFAKGALGGASGWKGKAYPPLVANAVRQLLAVSPDLQTS